MFSRLLGLLLVMACVTAVAQGGHNKVSEEPLLYSGKVDIRGIPSSTSFSGLYKFYCKFKVSSEGNVYAMNIVDVPVKRAPRELMEFVKNFVAKSAQNWRGSKSNCPMPNDEYVYHSINLKEQVNGKVYQTEEENKRFFDYYMNRPTTTGIEDYFTSERRYLVTLLYTHD